jgi:hypothetical protein
MSQLHEELAHSAALCSVAASIHDVETREAEFSARYVQRGADHTLFDRHPIPSESKGRHFCDRIFAGSRGAPRRGEVSNDGSAFATVSQLSRSSYAVSSHVRARSLVAQRGRMVPDQPSSWKVLAFRPRFERVNECPSIGLPARRYVTQSPALPALLAVRRHGGLPVRGRR